METFNLRWPGGDARLHTNGVRCRLVWRAANGTGGSIENSDLAKRRVAAGLRFAPTLLDELKQAGYLALAAELAGVPPPSTDSAPAPHHDARRPARKSSASRASAGRPAQGLPSAPKKAMRTQEKPRVARWLDALPEASFEVCGVRRAAKWHHGKTWTDGLSLKTPVAGKGDWVLRIEGDETRYLAAESFAGICRFLASEQRFATNEFIEGFLEGCKALRQKEVTSARQAWQATVK